MQLHWLWLLYNIQNERRHILRTRGSPVLKYKDILYVPYLRNLDFFPENIF